MTIVIGSCGGLVGVFLAKHFKTVFKDAATIGFDANSRVYSRFILDEFYNSPRASDEDDFLDFLGELRLKVNDNIVVYCPTHSSEVLTATKYYQEIVNMGYKFSFHPYDSMLKLSDKYEAYLHFKEMNIPVPKFSKVFSKDLNFPVIAKPRVSSGSKNVYILRNSEEYRDFAMKNDGYIYSEFLRGVEYTVDTFFVNGYLIGFVPRKRLKTIGGAAVISESDFSISSYVEDYLNTLGKKFKLNGPANFQFFLTDDGIFFTDMNLRFPSGGLPLSTYLGLDMGKFCVLNSIGGRITSSINRKRVIMYRYFEEFFEEIN